MIIETHIVPDIIPRKRFLDYSVDVIKTLSSRTSIKKAIKKGELLLDGEMAAGGTWLQPGQKIELLETKNKPPKAFEMELEVVFEDESLAVIHKPAGISVSGNKYKTIQNALISNLQNSKEPDALKWPRPVHRLDYGTSGLLLVAKTTSTLAKLGRQFEERQIKKTYRALVVGELDEEGEIKERIEEKESITRYKVISRVPSLYTDWISLVEVYPETGRTHQIRIHMAHIGHPVLGDSRYGKEMRLLKKKGLFLASVGISFQHPVSGELQSISIKMPEKFTKRLQTELRRWDKYHTP
ncbi:MAG: RluA family pseudouridine synthase [Bacteroidales bacterium]|nr:RluA family pseudouridine synthase [Bacteroidales bacterium]